MLDRNTMMKAEERLENLALWDAAQKMQPNSPVLKEAVADLMQILTQKTAGQRKGKPSDLSWDRVPYVKMAILVEAVALVMSGALDKLEEEENAKED